MSPGGDSGELVLPDVPGPQVLDAPHSWEWDKESESIAEELAPVVSISIMLRTIADVDGAPSPSVSTNPRLGVRDE